MPRHARGVLLRSVQSAPTSKGVRAGGKAGKRSLGPKVRQAIHDAIRMEEEGRNAEAARAFGDIAAIAGARGRHAAAAHLAVRGALAALAAGDAEGALALGQRGVTLAEGVAEPRRVAARFLPLLAALDEERSRVLREAICAGFGLKRVAARGEPVALNRAQRRALAKRCPCCGEAVDPKAVVFVDDGIDCPLCGDRIA